MTFKTILLASSSALVLAATGALADNNEAFLDQVGANNSGLIDQTGGEGNRAGSALDPILQTGDTALEGNNSLSILQSSNNNEIGLINGGVEQSQRNQFGMTPIANTATLVQQGGDGNVIGGVSQRENGGPGSSNIPNALSVTQDGTTNTVSMVDQIGKPNDSNTATVTQTGTSNSIALVEQKVGNNGSGVNSMTLTQTGELNVIGTASQLGTRNTMTAVLSGDGNGSMSFTSNGVSFANQVGVPQGDLTQEGSNNDIDLMVTGNLTRFGISQDGVSNTVGLITITGNSNELAILQDGNGNQVNLSDIASGFNNIGIWQYQNDNQATVDIASGSNGNKFGIYQDGMTNDASVDISGGSNNGIGQPFNASGALTGAALTVSGTAGWERGMVKQIGELNTASLTVDGSSNAFGTLQDGANNDVSGSQTGTWNQMAVVQMGSMNMSDTTQNGSGNSAGVMQ